MNINQIKFALQFLDEFKKKKLPIKILIAVADNETRLLLAFQNYNNKLSDIINEYAKKDDEGNVLVSNEQNNKKSIEFDEEREDERIKKMQEIQNIEIELIKIPISSLSCVDEDKRYDVLTAEELENLKFMIE